MRGAALLVAVAAVLAQAQEQLVIKTVEDFATWYGKMAEGDVAAAATNIVLETDLDMFAMSLQKPIGHGSDGCTAYQGVFDGQGHTVSNFAVFGQVDDNGFFCKLKGATVLNLDLADTVIIQAAIHGGALCGSVEASDSAEGVATTIRNVHSSATVGTGAASQDNCFGGLVGLVASATTFVNCSTSGSVQNAKTSGGFVGNVSESVVVEFDSCTTTATIQGEVCGGFVGYGHETSCASVVNSVSAARIDASNTAYGLAPQAQGANIGVTSTVLGQTAQRYPVAKELCASASEPVNVYQLQCEEENCGATTFEPTVVMRLDEQNQAYVYGEGSEAKSVYEEMNLYVKETAARKILEWNKLLQPVSLYSVKVLVDEEDETEEFVAHGTPLSSVETMSMYLNVLYITTNMDGTVTYTAETTVTSNMTIRVEGLWTEVVVLTNYTETLLSAAEFAEAMTKVGIESVAQLVGAEKPGYAAVYTVRVEEAEAESIVASLTGLTEETCALDIWCQRVLVCVSRMHQVTITEPVNEQFECKVGSTLESNGHANYTELGYVFVNNETGTVFGLDWPITENITLNPSHIVTVSGEATGEEVVKHGTTLADVTIVAEYVSNDKYAVIDAGTRKVVTESTQVVGSMELLVYEKKEAVVVFGAVDVAATETSSQEAKEQLESLLAENSTSVFVLNATAESNSNGFLTRAVVSVAGPDSVETLVAAVQKLDRGDGCTAGVLCHSTMACEARNQTVTVGQPLDRSVQIVVGRPLESELEPLVAMHLVDPETMDLYRTDVPVVSDLQLAVGCQVTATGLVEGSWTVLYNSLMAAIKELTDQLTNDMYIVTVVKDEPTSPLPPSSSSSSSVPDEEIKCDANTKVQQDVTVMVAYQRMDVVLVFSQVRPAGDFNESMLQENLKGVVDQNAVLVFVGESTVEQNDAGNITRVIVGVAGSHAAQKVVEYAPSDKQQSLGSCEDGILCECIDASLPRSLLVTFEKPLSVSLQVPFGRPLQSLQDQLGRNLKDFHLVEKTTFDQYSVYKAVTYNMNIALYQQVEVHGDANGIWLIEYSRPLCSNPSLAELFNTPTMILIPDNDDQDPATEALSCNTLVTEDMVILARKFVVSSIAPPPNKGGLSTGGAVALALGCVLLVAVAIAIGVVLYLNMRKKKVDPEVYVKSI